MIKEIIKKIVEDEKVDYGVNAYQFFANVVDKWSSNKKISDEEMKYLKKLFKDKKLRRKDTYISNNGGARASYGWLLREIDKYVKNGCKHVY